MYIYSQIYYAYDVWLCTHECFSFSVGSEKDRLSNQCARSRRSASDRSHIKPIHASLLSYNTVKMLRRCYSGTTSIKPVPTLRVNILIGWLSERCYIQGLVIGFRVSFARFHWLSQPIRVRFARSRPFIYHDLGTIALKCYVGMWLSVTTEAKP